MTAWDELYRRAVRMKHFISSYRADITMIARAKLILVLALFLGAASGTIAQPKTSPSAADFQETETLLQQRVHRVAEADHLTEGLVVLDCHGCRPPFESV